MSGDLPSSLLITKNFVATSGEEKFYHLTQKRLGAQRKFSLQEAGRALAMPLDHIHLSYLNSQPFLVRSSNDASGD